MPYKLRQTQVNQHLQTIALIYSGFSVASHYIYAGIGLGLSVALASSALMIALVLWKRTAGYTLLAPLVMSALGIAYFIDAPANFDLFLHVAILSFVVGLCLVVPAAFILICVFFLSIFLATETLLSLDKYFAPLLAGALGMYLRWLLFGQADSIKEISSTDLQSGCRNADSLKRDLAQYFNLSERYQIPSTLLVLDVKLEKQLSLEQQNSILDAAVAVWQSRIRQTDHLYKLSDRRFACLLTATGFDQAKALESDLLSAVTDYQFPHESHVRMRVKIVSCMDLPSNEQWLAFAYR